MSQIDDLMRSSGRSQGIGSSSSNPRRPVDPVNMSIEDYIKNLPLASSVIDRSEFINPDQIIASRDYTNDEAGQLKMQQDLNALRTYAAQQEAAYLEYYNSPGQQKLRDREAGLNPDLIGLSGSEGVQSNPVTSNPTEGIQSDEEIRSQKIQNATSMMSAISGIFSSVASVASIPSVFKGMKLTDSQIGLNTAQTNAINVGASGSLLGNLETFEKLAGNEINSRLSDSVAAAIKAGQSINIADWFSDDNNFSNILESYSPDASPQYAASFANLRKRMQQTLGNAYNQGKITAENQGAFSSLVADSRYSSDQLTQIAMLRPYMAAQAKAELAKLQLEESLSTWNKKYQNALSVDTAVDAANSKNEYDAEFWSNMDAELQSAFENYQASVEMLSMQFSESINENLLEIYRQNPDNEKGFAAAYLFKSGSNASLQDYFYSNNMTEFSNMIQNQMKILDSEAKNSERFFKFRSYQPMFGLRYGPDQKNFGPNAVGRKIWKSDVNKYLNLLEDIANSN